MGNLIAAALTAILISACNASGEEVAPSGSGGQRSFNAAGFSSVELAGPYNVVVAVGGQHSVRAEGDEAALERLDIRLDGDRLRIGTIEGSWGSNSGRATVFVTAPSLNGAHVAGSGDMRVGAFRSARFDGSVAGSGNLLVERVEADAAEFDIAGSGDIRAAGRVREADISIAGSGNGALGGLEADRVDISIAGSGNAEIRSGGTADVSVMGSGNVVVTGGARCSVSKMGSGDVRCG